MAATVVQSVKVANSGVTSQTTPSMTTAATGSTFAIQFNGDASLTPTVTDNKGNTYTLVKFLNTVTASEDSGLWWYVCENGIGGSGHTATVAWKDSGGSAAAQFTPVFFAEIADTGKIVRVDTGSIGTSIGTSKPFTATSGSFDSSTTLALLAFCNGGSGNPYTYTEGTGFSQYGIEDDNNSFWGGAVWYKAISSTSAVTPSVSPNFTANPGLMVVFGLKSDGGSSPTTTTATPAAGAATVSGAGSSAAASSGSSAGTSSVSGVGSSSAATTATASAGAATVSATSNAITATTATAAAGTSTVSAVGAAVNGTAATAAAGTSTVSAAGSSTAATAGQAAGAATVSAVGASTAAAAGSASGSATVSASGSSSASTTATPAAGTSIVSAVGSSVDAGQTQAVPAAGTSIVAAQGASIAAADPVPAQGTSIVSATTPSSAAGGYEKDRKRQKKFIEQAVEAANRAVLAEQAEHVAQALVQVVDEEDEDEILMLLL